MSRRPPELRSWQCRPSGRAEPSDRGGGKAHQHLCLRGSTCQGRRPWGATGLSAAPVLSQAHQAHTGPRDGPRGPRHAAGDGHEKDQRVPLASRTEELSEHCTAPRSQNLPSTGLCPHRGRVWVRLHAQPSQGQKGVRNTRMVSRAGGARGGCPGSAGPGTL